MNDLPVVRENAGLYRGSDLAMGHRERGVGTSIRAERFERTLGPDMIPEVFECPRCERQFVIDGIPDDGSEEVHCPQCSRFLGVRDILKASDDWSPASFASYGEERRERMRRLRFVVSFPFPGIPERRAMWASSATG